jgi:hypothetical protein
MFALEVTFLTARKSTTVMLAFANWLALMLSNHRKPSIFYFLARL